MDERRSDGNVASIDARAKEFLAHVERLASTTSSREDAFDIVFGLGGSYVTLFPTMDDRLAFRELPTRRQAFAMLCRLPASGRSIVA